MRANAIHWRVFLTRNWANLVQNPTVYELSLAPSAGWTVKAA